MFVYASVHEATPKRPSLKISFRCEREMKQVDSIDELNTHTIDVKTMMKHFPKLSNLYGVTFDALKFG